MKTIQSAHNETIKLLAKLLRSSKERRKQQLTVLEGAHLTQAYLNAPLTPLQLFVPEHKLKDPETQTILARLPDNQITLIHQQALNKISDLTQSDEIMCLIRLPPNAPCPSQQDCVALENLQDMGNLGTILRSAVASGIQHIVLDKHCADVYAPKVLRAGMGAHFSLKISHQIDLPDFFQHYQSPIYATALAPDSESLYQQDLRTPALWLFGNEGNGISPALQECAHKKIIIPMVGATESLNVAMATSICLFEQMRQRL